MSVSLAASTHNFAGAGFSAALRVGKQILNAVAERWTVAADRSRFAALPQRHLEDIGMTVGERAAILEYDEPMIDAWRVVASHL